jgi:hypothetical protein
MVSVPLGAISNVWPSGGALATAEAAITLPAPGLFSTMNGLPSRSASRAPNVRATDVG